jgi:hypothetical protein
MTKGRSPDRNPLVGKEKINLKKFLQDTNLYLYVNSEIYNTDVKKIAFTLSFMNEGDAASWKEQLLEEASALPMFDLGTWKFLRKTCSRRLNHTTLLGMP